MAVKQQSYLKLFSLNANGLKDDVKRRAVFRKLQNKCKGIIFLQETHSTPEVEHVWRNEWGGDIVFSHGESNSRGVAVLFPRDFEVKINDCVTDKKGRMILLSLSIEDDTCILINVYAPTRDQKTEQNQFIKELGQNLSAFEGQTVLIGGDFNFYMDPQVDKLDSMSHQNDNPLYRKEIQSLLEAHELTDVWQVLNPAVRRYSWRRGRCASRLDYWFISEHLLNSVHEVDILPGFHSDHSIVTVSLGTEQPKRGRGLWKFNTSLLHNTEYVTKIKNIIKDMDEHLSYLEDKGLKWEMIKMKIRDFTIPFTVKIKKKNNKIKQDLQRNLDLLHQKIDTDSSESIINEYYSAKHELEQIEKHEACGIMIRSKAKWIEEGEKNTKYFLSLEKRNYCNKLITQIQVGDTVIDNQEDILKEEKYFYENLYKEHIDTSAHEYKNVLQEFMHQLEVPQLSEEDKMKCEEGLTESELLKSIKELKNKKTPGTDGLPPEFYKFFWIDIKNILIESYNYAFYSGELSIEQRRGIITLIPKKQKNRLFLKNWRPITLLNTDYKILAKVLAKRFELVISIIINEDQTGYIKNRYIGQNIRTVEDVISFTDIFKLPGIILSVDFEKAFDSINWNFIDVALEKFNFGNNMRRWINIMYKNIQSAVINNGNITPWFYPKRGIRQGCPMSALLFIIAVEILAQKIRQNESVEGIKVGDGELKVSQLADDTTCFVRDIQSLEYAIDIFQQFQSCAGLKVNRNKTKAKYIGTLRNTRNYPFNLAWTEDYIETLGVVFTDNESDNYRLNYEPRIISLKNILHVWKQRHLSLKGKITVINSLAIAPLVYIASVTAVPKRVIKEVNSIIFEFLWNSKQPKVANNVMIQKIEDGGLKMMDFESKLKALKISWVNRLIDHHANWQLAPKRFYNTHDLNFFFSSKPKIRNNNSIPLFYREILTYWSELHNVEPTSGLQVRSEIIWNNIFITSNKSTLFWNEWYQHGVVRIGDILNRNGDFLSHKEIQEKFHVQCNFLNILQLRQSIPFKWRSLLRNENVPVQFSEECCLILGNNMIDVKTLKCKDFYWRFVQSKKRIPTCIVKWSERFTPMLEDDGTLWKRLFKQPFLITKETKLQSFQFRILHRIVPCNKWLYNLKVRLDSKCSFCNDEDTITHFFLYCDEVKKMWNRFFMWWNNISNQYVISTNEESLLFGYNGNDDISEVFNYCVLLCKYYIYKQRLYNDNKLDLYEYLKQLKHKLQIMKIGYSYEGKISRFEKWLFIYENL